jgi:hypothetical protein
MQSTAATVKPRWTDISCEHYFPHINLRLVPFFPVAAINSDHCTAEFKAMLIEKMEISRDLKAKKKYKAAAELLEDTYKLVLSIRDLDQATRSTCFLCLLVQLHEMALQASHMRKSAEIGSLLLKRATYLYKQSNSPMYLGRCRMRLLLWTGVATLFFAQRKPIAALYFTQKVVDIERKLQLETLSLNLSRLACLSLRETELTQALAQSVESLELVQRGKRPCDDTWPSLLQAEDDFFLAGCGEESETEAELFAAPSPVTASSPPSLVGLLSQDAGIRDIVWNWGVVHHAMNRVAETRQAYQWLSASGHSMPFLDKLQGPLQTATPQKSASALPYTSSRKSGGKKTAAVNKGKGKQQRSVLLEGLAPSEKVCLTPLRLYRTSAQSGSKNKSALKTPSSSASFRMAPISSVTLGNGNRVDDKDTPAMGDYTVPRDDALEMALRSEMPLASHKSIPRTTLN